MTHDLTCDIFIFVSFVVHFFVPVLKHECYLSNTYINDFRIQDL